MKHVYTVKRYSEKGSRVWLTVEPRAARTPGDPVSMGDSYFSVISLPKTFDFRPKRVILTDDVEGGETNA